MNSNNRCNALIIVLLASVVLTIAVQMVVKLLHQESKGTVKSRKNTIAARPTGYIQESIKTRLTIRGILAAEPLIIPRVFGLMLLNTAVFWGVFLAGFSGVRFALRKLTAFQGRHYS